jgi:hypothetical protein
VRIEIRRVAFSMLWRKRVDWLGSRGDVVTFVEDLLASFWCVCSIVLRCVLRRRSLGGVRNIEVACRVLQYGKIKTEVVY